MRDKEESTIKNMSANSSVTLQTETGPLQERVSCLRTVSMSQSFHYSFVLDPSCNTPVLGIVLHTPNPSAHRHIIHWKTAGECFGREVSASPDSHRLVFKRPVLIHSDSPGVIGNINS